MSDNDLNKHIGKNIKKYRYYLDTIKLLNSYIDTNKHKHLSRSDLKEFIKTNYRIKLKIINEIYDLYRMYEMMDNKDEQILEVKKETILNAIKYVSDNYIKDNIKSNSSMRVVKILSEAGIL